MRKNLPPQPSRTALLEQCEHAPEQAVDLLQLLWEKLEEQQIQIEKQTKEIAKLKAKLSLNSRNSSKPPSTDKSNPGGGAPKKKDSNPGRRKGPKRKPGAQKGHKGSTLEQTLHPDFRVELEAPKKCNCGEDLSDLPACGKQVRQILDLPENIKIQTTEYQARKEKRKRKGVIS
jgi:hypothetical protein